MQPVDNPPDLTHPPGADRVPRDQGRQMVAARRCAIRRGDPSHGDRQDPEDQAARGLQGL